MQISIEYDYVFLCQPKCASTTIEKALTFQGRASIKYINTRQYTKFLDYISQKIGSELKLPPLNQSPLRPIETLKPTLQIALEKDIAFYNTVPNRDWS
ncbi:MAG: hypothetical protein P8Y43_02875 [Sulfurovaceae bacterium]|jgi:hypothetical protein